MDDEITKSGHHAGASFDSKKDEYRKEKGRRKT
jgi:hypothetical protein